MEFNYEEFKKKCGEEAAELVKSEVELAKDLNLTWVLEINHENEHWISFLFVTSIDTFCFKVYKEEKIIRLNCRISKPDCEKALKIMSKLGA